MNCMKLVVAWTMVLSLAGQTDVFAQGTESQYRAMEEIHVAPGMTPAFESRNQMRNGRMAAGNVSFTRLAGVNENGVYRFLTLLTDEFSSVEMWRSQIGAMPPATPRTDPNSTIIQRIDRSVHQTRPELSYVPDNPRLQPGEAGAFRTITLYVGGRDGAAAEVATLLQRMKALEESRDQRDGRTVSSPVIASDVRRFEITFLARDRASLYANRDERVELLGEELQELVSQISRLCSRIEFNTFTIRPDLRYAPSN
jgi:hypothetical protein